MKRIILLFMVALVTLSACNVKPNEGNDKAVTNESETGTDTHFQDSENTNPDLEKYEGQFTEKDLIGYYDEVDATYISFFESETEIKGLGASLEYDGTEVFIYDAGVYILSGNFEGQIHVDSDKLSKIQIVLNGANIHCEKNSAIYIGEADKVFVTSALGTENKLSDGMYYAEFNNDSGCDATVFSRSDLVINGSGKLIIESSFKHGIVSKDDLKICGTQLDITAPNSAIIGKDSVRIANGRISLTAGSDGIKSNNDMNAQKGYICIFDSDITICSGKDSFQAESSLKIAGGKYRLFSGETVFNFAASAVLLKNAEIVSMSTYLVPLEIDSSYSSIRKTLPSAAKAGDVIRIFDGDKLLIEEKAPTGGGMIYVASSLLESGKNYSVIVGEQSFSETAK